MVSGIAQNTTGAAYNSLADTAMVLFSAPLLAAQVGLLPGETIIDQDGDPALKILNPYIICWVEDAMDHDASDNPHDRSLRVDSTQSHGGAELGLWKATYPDTTSYSKVDFSGNGKIFLSQYNNPPVPRHDASIIETDRIGQH
jgi:hypothetical protein